MLLIFHEPLRFNSNIVQFTFMDMLGFGRSSRPTYSRDPLQAEQELVESIEAWRKVVGLERFMLLGHSLGAYLATVYAFKYPDRIVEPYSAPVEWYDSCYDRTSIALLQPYHQRMGRSCVAGRPG
ncbi:(Lyso)-N-acylphosphatidylethanolamine lipase [Hyalella azteca]|uniref:(Lyso)-N-acylphosphatidylethanolamine lipase n=1 Tax=Hyalella azteca TaxID=294128 RepID=A0A8B7NWJ8_HYAAZ|nr:(Lyso)-N-acylphosphatidylethanolamine lipase [Hyalella azteca]